MAEKAGVPTVSIVCDGFVKQANITAAGMGMKNLPLAAYPGAINLHTVEELEENVQHILIDQIEKGLMVQPVESKTSSEPEQRDIVATGTFEEINQIFLEKEWSDALPVVPPSIDKVEAFLKYTALPADHVIAALPLETREATPWNIAVNGVMAGCRAEYMPVLIALVEAMADPKFGLEHLGHTPGTEILITVNGPVIKDLKFNYEQGALRVGFQANTTIGRFWRLYLRNVAGFLPHKADKACFGGTWRVVLAENEDALENINWPTMGNDQGFEKNENIVTVNSCTSAHSIFSIGADSPEKILDKLAQCIVDAQLYYVPLDIAGPTGVYVRPQILMSPAIANALAKGGYTKERVKKYLYEHATFQVKRLETLFGITGVICACVENGKLPKEFCESDDPDRYIPVVTRPDDFMLTISGDPGRDNCFICAQNGFIGYPVSKKIKLPSDWHAMLKRI